MNEMVRKAVIGGQQTYDAVTQPTRNLLCCTVGKALTPADSFPVINNTTLDAADLSRRLANVDRTVAQFCKIDEPADFCDMTAVSSQFIAYTQRGLVTVVYHLKPKFTSDVVQIILLNTKVAQLRQCGNICFRRGGRFNLSIVCCRFLNTTMK